MQMWGICKKTDIKMDRKTQSPNWAGNYNMSKLAGNRQMENAWETLETKGENYGRKTTKKNVRGYQNK